MSAQALFEWRALDPFGIEIFRDMSQSLDEVEGQALKVMFHKEKLLVFRNQSLSEDQHVALLKHIGPVLEPRGESRQISSDGHLGAGSLCWHSDLAFTPEPFQGLSLYAEAVNPAQSTTLFANAARAAARLPDDLRSQIADLQAVAFLTAVQSHRQAPYSAIDFFPQQSRRAIIPHPETGEPILYVSEMQTGRIGDLPRGESDALLDRLFSVLYAPDNIYEHRWTNGDLLLWDNIGLQHSRPDLSQHKPRRLRRIVLAEKNFFDLCPQFDMDDPRVAAWGAGDVHAMDKIIEETGQ